MLLAPIIPTILFALVIVITLWTLVKKRKQKNSEEPYTPASDILSGTKETSTTPPEESNKKATYAEVTQLKEAAYMKERYPVMAEAAPFYFTGNDIGVLISHGFTGTTQSIREVGEKLANAGYTIHGPRLTGHGTHPKDMEKATYQDWMNDVEAGLTKLKEECSSVFVLGLSMGGTLALHLAEKHPDLAGIILVNAAIDMPEFENNYHKLQTSGERFVDGIGSDIKKSGVEELAYKQTPVQAMGELINLMEIVKGRLPEITVPLLIFSSKEDHVVPPSNANTIYDAIQSTEKQTITLEDSYHVATLDHDQDTIISEALTFMEKHTN